MPNHLPSNDPDLAMTIADICRELDKLPVGQVFEPDPSPWTRACDAMEKEMDK